MADVVISSRTDGGESMRRSRLSGFLILCTLVTTSVFASDVSGKWVGKTTDGYDVVLTLKSTNQQLSGTLLDAEGKTEYPLKEVALDGENLAFVVDIQYQGNPLRVIAKGKTAPEQIQLHLETQDGSWSSDTTLAHPKEPKGN